MNKEQPPEGRKYKLAQIFCEVESRVVIAIATEDGLPVRFDDVDGDGSHQYQVPTVKALIIPQGSHRRFYKASYCELCRRARLFTPLSDESFLEAAT